MSIITKSANRVKSYLDLACDFCAGTGCIPSGDNRLYGCPECSPGVNQVIVYDGAGRWLEANRFQLRRLIRMLCRPFESVARATELVERAVLIAPTACFAWGYVSPRMEAVVRDAITDWRQGTGM